MICLVLLPVHWLFFAASTYVWVQFVWHTGNIRLYLLQMAKKNFTSRSIGSLLIQLFTLSSTNMADHLDNCSTSVWPFTSTIPPVPPTNILHKTKTSFQFGRSRILSTDGQFMANFCICGSFSQTARAKKPTVSLRSLSAFRSTLVSAITID